MRHIVTHIPMLIALGLVPGCCNYPKNGSISSLTPPGLEEIGVDWDGTGSSSTFWLMTGFALSPGRIIELEIAGATTAAQVVDQIEAQWAEKVGVGSYGVEACGDHIVLFPENNVGYFAVLDSDGTWRPITSTSTYVTLANGLKVRKKNGACPY